MDTGKADVDIEEDLSAGVCTMASIKQSQSSSTESSCVDGAKAENQCITFGHETSPSGTADSFSSENVKDVQNAKCGKEVIIAVTDHENVKDVTSDTTPNDLYVVRNSISITGPMNGDADPGYTNIRNGSPSNSRSDAGAGLLEQNGEVLADVNDKENGITTTSVEQFRDDENSLTSVERDEEVLADVNDKVDGITSTSVEQSRDDDNSLTSSLLDTGSGSLKFDEATAKEIVTEAAEQDPVLVASEETHIPGTVCSSLHEKMLPTEQDIKSLPVEVSMGKELLSREVQRSGSDSVSAEGKDDSNAIEPSSVIAVVQEAEINARKRVQLEFDLNDEFWFEEVDPSAVPNEESNCDKADRHLIDQTTIVAAAVSSSRASVVPELPAGRLQFEGTLGWKGSTKTDAFCPASRRSLLENDIVTSSTGPSSSMKQSAHDFDLNMADDEVNANPDKKLDYLIPVSSSHPSEESCVEIGPRKLERKEFDLNSHGEAPSPACWSKNGLPFDQKNTHRSPSPTSSSSSVHPSVWDIDLNKKYLVPNVPSDPQHLANLSFNLGDPYRVMKPANSAISIMGTLGTNDSLLQSPLHPNWNVTGLGNLLPASLNLSPPLQSFQGIPISTVDSRDSPVLPHMMSPVQPPYLMNMMGSSPVLNGFGSSYCSSFDLNTDAGKRDEPHARQYLMSSQGGFPEPLSLAVSQGSSCLQKRKEPHSGWDMYQHGLKHHDAPPNT
ncbi:hypothetical protein QQ045_019635 [Rhodiola kirilowii]